MRVTKIYIFFQFVFIGNIFSQGSEDFNITIPNYKIAFSQYHFLNVVDSRDDTSNVGFIYNKLKRKTTLLQPQTPISGRLAYIVENFADSSLKGELLLQIRKLRFVQRNVDKADNGYFFFRANLFKKENDQYEKLAHIDTLLIVPNSDNSKKLEIEGSLVIANFITKNMPLLPIQKEKISYQQIIKMDSIEKSKTNAYSFEKYTDGVYATFESFKKQEPEYKEKKAYFRGSELIKIKIISAKKIKIKADPNMIYAVIEKGKIYISAESGYYEGYKKNNDFYFIEEVEMENNINEVMPEDALMDGGLSSLISKPKPKKIFFEIKIDHVNGEFTKGKRVYKY